MFLERSGCLRTAFLIEDGLDPQAAVEKIVFELSERYSASAGVLAIDAEGANRRRLSWAIVDRME